MTRNALGIVAVVLLAMLCTATASAACRVHTRVVLFGIGDDPGVFLWDSRFRLRAYHMASFDEAQALVRHASLISPGTRAEVLACWANFVQPKYRLSPDDAVDVRVLTGAQRGRTGWVLGSDVRELIGHR